MLSHSRYTCGLCRPPQRPHLTPSQWQARSGGYKHRHGQTIDSSTRPNHLQTMHNHRKQVSTNSCRPTDTDVRSPLRAAALTHRRARARILHRFALCIAHTVVHHAAGARYAADPLDAGATLVGRIAARALPVPVLRVELLTVAGSLGVWCRLCVRVRVRC